MKKGLVSKLVLGGITVITAGAIGLTSLLLLPNPKLEKIHAVANPSQLYIDFNYNTPETSEILISGTDDEGKNYPLTGNFSAKAALGTMNYIGKNNGLGEFTFENNSYFFKKTPVDITIKYTENGNTFTDMTSVTLSPDWRFLWPPIPPEKRVRYWKDMPLRENY